MKKSVTVSIDAEKLTALEMYLGQKNLKLAEELEKFSEQLYQKYVPSNVREFIELRSLRRSLKILLMRKMKINPDSNCPQFAPYALVWRFYGMGSVSLP